MYTYGQSYHIKRRKKVNTVDEAQSEIDKHKQIINKYLDRQLTKKDKDALCAELNRLDDKNRIIKWNKTKDYLIELGYKVKEDRNMKIRFSIISKQY